MELSRRLLRILFAYAAITGAALTTPHNGASAGLSQEEEAYREAIWQRASRIVAGLRLTDDEQATRVTHVIADQYRCLRDVHDARDKKLEELNGNQTVEPDLADRQKEIRSESDQAVLKRHRQFLAQLAAEFDPRLVDQVKDGMTYGVVSVTYAAYVELLPDLTADEKRRIKAELFEAREYAMDGGSSKEKHAWFGKYKGRINNYLSANGYDLKQAERDLAHRKKELSQQRDPPTCLVDHEGVRRYVDTFNASDEEDVRNAVPNHDTFRWIVTNAPLLDCPSSDLEEIYYFRWWTYRKHICQTPKGRVLTEFITPVSHAGPYNTISCALGHHITEGRWLRDQSLIDEYMDFWLHSDSDGGPAKHFHKFSSWATAALYQRYLVTGDGTQLVAWLDDLIADYQRWESERLRPDGLFWQHDVRDGMEESISGGRRTQNVRPTINCYMFANAQAISRIARLAGRPNVADKFAAEAERLRTAAVKAMWDPHAKFFKVRLESGELSDAREAIGYIPWMFSLAGKEHAVAWKEIRNPEGFWAPCGLTTAERRHPQFRSHGTGTCEWDGAVWPFATSQTLVGLANLLRGPEQPYVSRADFFQQLLRYAAAHRKEGKAYIGEYHDETTGQWLITGPKARRSRFYNHSTFNDLVISGLIGIVPHADDTIEVDPLLPDDVWNWFCLEGVPYHGRSLTILWDRTGTHYNRGTGLSIWVDGSLIASSSTLGRLAGQMPATNSP